MYKSLATGRHHYVGPLLITLIVIFILFCYWPTFVAIVAGSPGADKYSHRVFVLPIFFATIWSIREKLAELPVKVCWAGLVPLLACGAGWLLGELAFIQSLRSLAAILLIPMTVLTVLGYQWAVAACFPLSFLVFAVPFFGPVVPVLVDMTAAFTFVALQWSGITVFREGPYFELSTGRWSIVDACSGIEYLSAVMMFSALFAWTVFDNNRKRVVFFAGAILVGIVGNWVRAYLTMLIAHVSENQYLREDHGSFGWYLFAALLFSYCYAGWHFRDAQAVGSSSALASTIREEIEAKASPIPREIIIIALLASLAITAWPLANRVLSQAIKVEKEIKLPRVKAIGNWTEAYRSAGEWAPALVNPTILGVQSFEKAGRRVDLHIGVFANESPRSKLVTSVNKFVDSDSRSWSQVSDGRSPLKISGAEISAKTGVMVGGGQRVIAWQWYWINGRSTGSVVQAKLWQLAGKLRGNADIGVWLAVSTHASGTDSAAEQLLRNFIEESGPEILKALDTVTTR